MNPSQKIACSAPTNCVGRGQSASRVLLLETSQQLTSATDASRFGNSLSVLLKSKPYPDALLLDFKMIAHCQAPLVRWRFGKLLAVGGVVRGRSLRSWVEVLDADENREKCCTALGLRYEADIDQCQDYPSSQVMAWSNPARFAANVNPLRKSWLRYALQTESLAC